MVKHKMKIGNRDLSDILLMTVIYFFLLSFLLICIFPFLNVFAKSISGEADVLAGAVTIIPKNIHFNAYKYVTNQRSFFASLKNSLIVTVTGTILALFVAGMSGYALARKRFQEHRLIMMLYIFSMIFSAGVIPGYLLVRSLGLYDTIWALILPAIINPYYLLILKSFFQAIPESLEEAAKMDGAGHFRIYFQIIMPIAKPALASVCLFYAVDYWNDLFRPMVFITSQAKYTLQLYLRSILINTNDVTNTLDPLVYGNVAAQSVQNATIIVSIIPILLLFPFLQKYFATGVSVGAVKE